MEDAPTGADDDFVLEEKILEKAEMMTTPRITTPMSVPQPIGLAATRAPHLGQVSASELTSVSHSLHLISAIDLFSPHASRAIQDAERKSKGLRASAQSRLTARLELWLLRSKGVTMFIECTVAINQGYAPRLKLNIYNFVSSNSTNLFDSDCMAVI